MDRETVIRLAREAEFSDGAIAQCLRGYERFAELVAEHYLAATGSWVVNDAIIEDIKRREREACAALCDDADARFLRRAEGRLMTEAGADAYRSASSGALQCALAIRARGKKA